MRIIKACIAGLLDYAGVNAYELGYNAALRHIEKEIKKKLKK